MGAIKVPSIIYADEVRPLRDKHSNQVNIVLVNIFDLERLFTLSEPQSYHLFNKHNTLLTATHGPLEGQMSYSPHKMSVLNKDLRMLWCHYTIDLVF